MKPPGPIRVYIRYFRHLLWEFRWSLGVFWGLVFCGGLAVWSSRETLGYLEACHGVFLLIFLEAALDFPDQWYLQPFFFLVPIIGLVAVADSLVRLGYLVFSRKSKLQEWQRMVVSLYKDHVVVVGVGKVGLQIIKELAATKESVVAIELEEDSSFLEEIRDLGIPVIQGDGRQQKTLEQAGVQRARAVILVTDSDLANLDSALTAQDLNTGIRVVLRLFDETLATKVQGAFSMPAISISHVAAPAFIAAATERRVYQSVQLGNRKLHMIDLCVRADGRLVGANVGSVQRDNEVNIVLHETAGDVTENPSHEIALQPRDTILVLAPLERLVALSAENHPEGHESVEESTELA